MGLISRVSSRTYRKKNKQTLVLKTLSMTRSRSRSPARDDPRDRDQPRKYRSDELHSVRIGNDLPDDVTLDEIRDVFDKFGEIGDVFLPKDRYTGRTLGFGFVGFVKKDDREYCLDQCKDGIKVAGVETKVEFTAPRDPNRGRGGRGGYGDRRGGYDDRRGGYGDRRGGYDDRRGGYDRRDDYRRRSRSPPRRDYYW